MPEHPAAVPTSLRSSCLPAVCLVLASRGARTSNSCRACEGQGREPVLVAEPVPRHRALSTARRACRYEQLVSLVACATRGAASPDQCQLSPARTRPRQTARSGLIRSADAQAGLWPRPAGRTAITAFPTGSSDRLTPKPGAASRFPCRTPALQGLAALCACCWCGSKKRV